MATETPVAKGWGCINTGRSLSLWLHLPCVSFMAIGIQR